MSAGLLIYRYCGDMIEVLLVHPGGPFWTGKDEGSWSIPKGEYAASESPLDAAVREFEEETGFEAPSGPLVELRPVTQRGGKVVHAWAAEGDFDATKAVSNRFSMEWPPKSGREQMFPEVDRAQWFNLEEASRKIVTGQTPLLEELRRLLSSGGKSSL